MRLPRSSRRTHLGDQSPRPPGIYRFGAAGSTTGRWHRLPACDGRHRQDACATGPRSPWQTPAGPAAASPLLPSRPPHSTFIIRRSTFDIRCSIFPPPTLDIRPQTPTLTPARRGPHVAPAQPHNPKIAGSNRAPAAKPNRRQAPVRSMCGVRRLALGGGEPRAWEDQAS